MCNKKYSRCYLPQNRGSGILKLRVRIYRRVYKLLSYHAQHQLSQSEAQTSRHQQRGIRKPPRCAMETVCSTGEAVHLSVVDAQMMLPQVPKCSLLAKAVKKSSLLQYILLCTMKLSWFLQSFQSKQDHQKPFLNFTPWKKGNFLPPRVAL